MKDNLIITFLMSLEFEVLANTFSKGFFRQNGDDTKFTLVQFYAQGTNFYTAEGTLVKDQYDALNYIIDKLQWKP